MFAPPLFHGCRQPLVNNFDPPFFLETPLFHHGARSGRDNIGIPFDTTDPVFDPGHYVAREDESVGMGGPSLD